MRCLRHIQLELLVGAVLFSHLSIGLRFVVNELLLRRGCRRLVDLDRLRDDLSLSLILDLLKLKLLVLVLSRRLRLSLLCLAVVAS